MATNKYGLDCAYFKKNLRILIRDIQRYTPDEMHRALNRLAEVAKPESNRLRQERK